MVVAADEVVRLADVRRETFSSRAGDICADVSSIPAAATRADTVLVERYLRYRLRRCRGMIDTDGWDLHQLADFLSTNCLSLEIEYAVRLADLSRCGLTALTILVTLLGTC